MFRRMNQSQAQSTAQTTNQQRDIHGSTPDNIRVSGIAGAIATIIFIGGAFLAILLTEVFHIPDGWLALIIIVLYLAAFYILFALKVARQWEKAVVLRLGKFQGLRGPGLFWMIPILDNASSWIDQRVMVSPFNAEKTLTKDTVPVDVDAVLFWLVWDAEKAALE